MLGLSSRAIIGRFVQAYEQGMSESDVISLGMMFASDQESETYRWLGQVPKVREWIGARDVQTLLSRGLTIVNKKFESSLRVDLDDIRRDKTGQIMMRINELALAAGPYHWFDLLNTLILNGTGAASGLAYDGQFFFDTDHSEGSSGAQKNLLTNAEVLALNVAAPTAPTEAEFATALFDVISWFYTLVDDKGRPMNGQARSFAVMTPISLSGRAQGALTKNTLISAGGPVDNPLKASGWSIRNIPNPGLNWTDKFAVFRTDGQTKPFILQEEYGPQMKIKGAGSEFEFDYDAHEYGVDCSRNAGYGQWQHALLATFS